MAKSVEHGFELNWGGHVVADAAWSSDDWIHEEQHKLFWVVRGGATYEVRSEEGKCARTVLEPKHLYIVPGRRKQRHRCDKHIAFHFMHFRAWSLDLDRRIAELPGVFSYPVSSPLVREVLSQIGSLFDERRGAAFTGHADLQIQGILMLFIGQELKRTGLSERVLDPAVERLKPAVDFMNARFTENPPLEAVARVVRLHPVHFHRQFTRAFGITPHNFILRRKMDLAHRLLVTTNEQIKAIGYKCGFDDPGYFSRVVHRYFGATPQDLRTANRSAAAAPPLDIAESS
jgi:AraC-like DNA-binding protein